MLKPQSQSTANAGMTLIEVVIATAVFLVVATAIYDGYVSVFKMVTGARVQLSAVALANEQLEIIRNMPYQDVGLIGGLPAGKLSRFQTISRNNIPFSVRLSIRDIDDPFDGQIGSSTAPDLAPNDYKLAEVEISCAICQGFNPFAVSTYVSPKNLENNTGNGALFVQVLDSSGQPVVAADVHIVLASSTSPVDITERTNQSGMFQLVNTYPANIAYQITVSKTGYSSDRTYAPGEAGIANPVKPSATVVAGQVTQLSFVIDPVSSLQVKTMTRTCTSVPNVSTTWQGTKLLGTNPDLLKINQTLTTDGLGSLILSGVEPDTYRFTPNLAGYVLVGSLPLQSLLITPASSNQIKMVLAPANGQGLLVSVRDGATSLPLSNATVQISGPGGAQNLVTDQGFWVQSDWSGGPGQSLWSATDRFDNSDGNLNYSSTTGQLKLAGSAGNYASDAYLVSSAFDTGSATTSYIQLAVSPLTQVASTGPLAVRLQLASADDPATTTWNYSGPDGTVGTYYTATTTTVNSGINNHRYLRYKLFLHTDDPTVSPVLYDLSFTYSSECLPFGQVYFDSLLSGTYIVNISHAGYQDTQASSSVNGAWQFLEVPLMSL